MINEKSDHLVLDCYVKSLDILLKGRKAHIVPSKSLRVRLESGPVTKADYLIEILAPWRSKITSLFVVDIFAVYEPLQQLVLIERWSFRYSKDDSKDSRPISNRRVQTFIRSLYSFVRLLPGFQLLTFPRAQQATLIFDVYSPDISRQPTPFTGQIVDYKFPPIGAAKSQVSVSVNYIPPKGLQSVLQIREHISSFYPRNNRHEKYPAMASAIPIPTAGGGAASSSSEGRSDARDREAAASSLSTSNTTRAINALHSDFRPSAGTDAIGIGGAVRQESHSLDSHPKRLSIIDNYLGGPSAAASSKLPISVSAQGGGNRARSVSDMGVPERATSRSWESPDDVAQSSSVNSERGLTRRLSCPGSPQSSARKSIVPEGGIAIAGGAASSFDTPTSTGPAQSSSFSYSPNTVSPPFAVRDPMNSRLKAFPTSGSTEASGNYFASSSPADSSFGISPPFQRMSLNLLSTSPQAATALSVQNMRDGLRRPASDRPPAAWRNSFSGGLAGISYAGFTGMSCTFNTDNDEVDMLRSKLPPSPFAIDPSLSLTPGKQSQSLEMHTPAAEATPGAVGATTAVTVAGAVSVGVGAGDDHDSSDDSEAEGESEFEGMAFAWTQPEALSASDRASASAPGAAKGSDSADGKASDLTTNAALTLCIAPPSLQSFKDAEISKQYSYSASSRSSQVIGAKVLAFKQFRQDYGSLFAHESEEGEAAARVGEAYQHS